MTRHQCIIYFFATGLHFTNPHISKHIRATGGGHARRRMAERRQTTVAATDWSVAVAPSYQLIRYIQRHHYRVARKKLSTCPTINYSQQNLPLC